MNETLKKIKNELKALEWEYSEDKKTFSFVFGNDEITINKKNGNISSMLGITYSLETLLSLITW